MQNTRSTLEQLIEKNAVGEDSMPFHSIHGFMTALAICPVDIERPEIINIILDGPSSMAGQDKKVFNETLGHIEDEIDRSFNEEEGFTLSCEADLDDAEDTALEDWCTGFMEAHFLAEDAWFKRA